MTNPEFNIQFDVLYDNISSNLAPGLNKYHKSVFLTRAQEELIKQYYSGRNLLQSGFDGSENVKRALDELVKPYKATTTVSSTNGISSDSKFFEIPENTYFIVFEQITLSDSDSCINGQVVTVRPTTYDEYNLSKKNPFRKPDKKKAWRLDVSKQSNKKVVEILSPYNISEYYCRYIEKPDPIVLTDFESDPELTGLSLTIDGINTNTECKLSPQLHSEILNRAVEMAIRAYRENTLQANVELNKNNV